MKFCMNCGAKLEDETKFCPSCGAPQEGKPAAPAQQPAPSEQEVPAQQSAQPAEQPAQGAAGAPAAQQPVPPAQPQQPYYGQPQYGAPQQPNYGQPQYGAPQQPYYGQPAPAGGVLTAEDVVRSGKVKGRYWAYRLAGTIIGVLFALMSMIYCLSAEVESGYGMGIPQIMGWVMALIGLLFNLVALALVIVSIFKAMGRKLIRAMFGVGMAFAAYGGILSIVLDMLAQTMSSAMSGSVPEVSVDALKIVFWVFSMAAGIALFVVGMGTKFDFRKPALTFVQKLVSWIVSGVLVILALVFALLPLSSSLGDPLARAEEVELGMSRSEVVAIMGEPHTESGSTLAWFDSATRDIMKRLEELDGGDSFENMFNDMEEAANLQEQLASMHSQALSVTLQDGSVYSVSFNADSQVSDKTWESYDSSAQLVKADTESSYLMLSVYLTYSDGSWTKMYDDATIEDMSLDLSDRTISVVWSYTADGSTIEEGTLERSVSAWGSEYNFNALVVYEDGYAEADLAAASLETLQAYQNLCNDNGVQYGSWLTAAISAAEEAAEAA